jgi:hypothetical protein
MNPVCLVDTCIFDKTVFSLHTTLYSLFLWFWIFVPDQEWQDSDGEPDQPALDATFNISNRDIEEDPEPQEEKCASLIII